MSTFRASLRAGRLLRVFPLGQLCHPKLVELVGLVGGFDAVWFDQEHAGLSTAQIEEASRAARAVGLDCFVRLPATDYAAVLRVLEAGAGGLMASMVRSLREVQDLVHWARFYPLGGRGINGSGVDGRYGSLPLLDYLQQANDRVAVGVQIEHADAVEVVEAIAAVPGIDFLFIGPADLSQSLGIPGAWDHPLLWQAIERVAAACKSANLPWAVMPFSLDFGHRCRDLGCRMFSLGIDVWAFQRGLRAIQADFAELFAP